MADRTLAVAFAPPGSTVEIHTSASPDTWAKSVDTNNDGYVTFQIDDSLGDSDIRITAEGYRLYQVHFRFRNAVDNATEPRPLNQQVNVGLDIPALVKEAAPLPPPEQLPSLNFNLRDFTDNGKRTVLRGTDEFLAFRQFLNGMDLTPFFRETRELGFNLWRVFMQGSIAQNTVLQLSPTEPGYYDHVRPFCDLLNSQGIVPLTTIGVDNQDIHSPAEHWTRMYDLIGNSRSIISKGNEFGKNGWNPSTIPNPAPGQVWSQGSGLSDEAPPRPEGPVFEFHPVRTFTTAMRDTVASPIELYEVQGYRGVMIIDEPGRFGSQRPSPVEFANPQHAYEYARLTSTLCGAVVFHNWPGQSGQLMDPDTRTCAAAFIRGLTLT